MNEKFERVDRSEVPRNQNIASELTAALLATLDTNEAIKVEFNGSKPITLQNRLASVARVRGLKLRMRNQKREGYAYFWVERRK